MFTMRKRGRFRPSVLGAIPIQTGLIASRGELPQFIIFFTALQEENCSARAFLFSCRFLNIAHLFLERYYILCNKASKMI